MSDLNKLVPLLEAAPEKRFTLSPVYAPRVLDDQGDWMEADDIEQAAHNFMRRLASGQAATGYRHIEKGQHIGDIVQSYVAPTDMEINGVPVAAGTWLIGVVWQPPYWDMVKRGQIKGLSMGGRAAKLDERM